MANNNLSATSTTSAPFFVPRIVMIATYDQSTQTRITSTINNFMQTITPTFITSTTQTGPFQSNEITPDVSTTDYSSCSNRPWT